MRAFVKPFTVLVVVLAVALTIPAIASACVYNCEIHSGCEECTYVGRYTGLSCWQSGPCTCDLILDSCWGSAETQEASVPLFSSPSVDANKCPVVPSAAPTAESITDL
jgi:hypothetical protein